MKQLDPIYREILTRGLIAVRDSAEAGDLSRCRAEAEHIHNIPSLIGEDNIHRHYYYFQQERVAYLEWLSSIDNEEVKKWGSNAYSCLWEEMGKILGIAQ